MEGRRGLLVGHMDEELEASGGLNLAERIRKLANGRNTLDVAQFQFIGIADIRDRYGERWREKRERVAQVARHFISRRIAPDDVLIAGADGFLLVFGNFTGFLADAAARQISKEMNAYFLGDPDLEDMQIDAQHHAMSVDDFARAFGAMISGSRELDVRTPALRASASPAPFTMGYTPVWDAGRGALATYFITPLDPATGFPLSWDQHSHRHADMDERKLNDSEADMRRLFASGGRALVGVAVHVSSLNGEQVLSRMVQAMARFDRKMVRYRVLRVSCVEPGYPRIYLEDVMRAVRPHAARIAIGLNWMEPDVASVLKLQPAAIGFSLPPGAMTQPSLRSEVFSRIAAAVEMARGYGVMIGVEGDLHAEHAQRFRQDGVNHLCSPRLWPVRPSLNAAETWPTARLDALVPPQAQAG
jgi:hypothetical protein